MGAAVELVLEKRTSSFQYYDYTKMIFDPNLIGIPYPSVSFSKRRSDKGIFFGAGWITNV